MRLLLLYEGRPKQTAQAQRVASKENIGGLARDWARDQSRYHLFGVRAVAGAYSCLMYSLTIRLVQKRGAMVLMLSLTM